jgi:hypothetical protein
MRDPAARTTQLSHGQVTPISISIVSTGPVATNWEKFAARFNCPLADFGHTET